MATAGRPPPPPPPPAIDSSPSSTLPSNGNAAGKSQETPFPPNSRRLTIPYLKAVAKAVGLPVTDSADETRVMIDGNLEEMGRDSRNVQVIVTRDQHGHETLSLRDVDGSAGRCPLLLDSRLGFQFLADTDGTRLQREDCICYTSWSI